MKAFIIILLFALPFVSKAQDTYPPSYILENCIDSALIEKYDS
jgi:hypothetical protein